MNSHTYWCGLKQLKFEGKNKTATCENVIGTMASLSQTVEEQIRKFSTVVQRNLKTTTIHPFGISWSVWTVGPSTHMTTTQLTTTSQLQQLQPYQHQQFQHQQRHHHQQQQHQQHQQHQEHQQLQQTSNSKPSNLSTAHSTKRQFCLPLAARNLTVAQQKIQWVHLTFSARFLSSGWTLTVCSSCSRINIYFFVLNWQRSGHLKELVNSTLCNIFPQTVVTQRGSYDKGKGRVLIEVLALRFRLRRNAVLRFYVDFDCAGSHKVCGPEIAISKASFYRVFLYVFGHELHFAWQVQGIRRMWRSETWAYVAGARNRTHRENRGRRSISWTLPKCWQACVVPRIALYVAGAGSMSL